MKFRLIFSTFIIILFAHTVEGQHTLIGKVIDKVTQSPISNVNIQIFSDKKFGYITDETGKFYIKTDKNSVLLKFSHISFKTKILKVNFKNDIDTSLIIKIEPKIYNIEEITITEDECQTVYKQKQESVLDYEIYKGRIYLIIINYYSMGYKIISINTNFSDTLFIKPFFKPKLLMKDIFGNIDVISQKDSVYQLVKDDNHLRVLDAFPYDEMLQVKHMYKFKIGSNYYFSEFNSSLKDKIDFGYVNANNKLKIFYSIVDENKVDYYYDVMCFLGIITHNNHVPPGEKRKKVVLKYYNSPALTIDKIFFYNNISDVFFNLKNDVFIVDNIQNKLLKFNKDGVLLAEKEIQYVNDKVRKLLEADEGRIWKNGIIIDIFDSTKVYFTQTYSSKIKLFYLDLIDCKIGFVKTLYHTYPQKIRIINKRIYYLYQKVSSLRNYGLFQEDMNYF